MAGDGQGGSGGVWMAGQRTSAWLEKGVAVGLDWSRMNHRPREPRGTKIALPVDDSNISSADDCTTQERQPLSVVRRCCCCFRNNGCLRQLLAA